MRSHIRAAALVVAATTTIATAAAAAPAPPSFTYLGEVRAFAFNYCPPSWLPADGRLMSIQQNTPLFALLGTSYGGNGATTFGLPNLQARAPIGPAQGSPIGTVNSAQFGGPQRFLTMTWCIAVQGTYPGRPAPRPR